jgi:hypothetical protein
VLRQSGTKTQVEIAYLETWYHVAAMLSCRYSGPGSVQYNRRLASADRILDLISHVGHEGFPPLPLVPYAMSMSTTVIYRAFRDNQRDLDSACGDLRLCYNALEAFSQRWTSARYVAKLAKRIWGVLVKSRVRNGLPDDGDEHAQKEPTSDDTGAGNSPTIVNQRKKEVAGMKEMFSDIPLSDQTLHEQHALDGNGHLQRHLIQDWPGINASYFQLDKVFDDLFDYGMPNVFRDPTTWQFTNISNDETNSLGSEFR